ncbi:hypothetical protein F5B21DRAFT_486758, partial [Xylaria acuta]
MFIPTARLMMFLIVIAVLVFEYCICMAGCGLCCRAASPNTKLGASCSTFGTRSGPSLLRQGILSSCLSSRRDTSAAKASVFTDILTWHVSCLTSICGCSLVGTVRAGEAAVGAELLGVPQVGVVVVVGVTLLGGARVSQMEPIVRARFSRSSCCKGFVMMDCLGARQRVVKYDGDGSNGGDGYPPPVL